jgi:hypothetical protein
MALFVVVALQNSAQAIGKSIADNFADDFYEVEKDKWFVATTLVTAKQVSDKLGITTDDKLPVPPILTGIVVRVGGYFGRGSTDMWEWIAAKSVKTSG